MRRTTITSLVLFLCASLPAISEIVVRTKDGRVFKLPVESAEIASIEFSGQGASFSTQSLSGRWRGTYRNSLGVSGQTALRLSTEGNKITGDLDGEAFQNCQWDGQTLTWSYYSETTKTTYHCEFKLTGENKGKLTYQATGAKTYSGSVEDFVRQK